MTFRVLFVCTGNVCRSPAAERLLRAGADNPVLDVGSAGTHALVGEPIDPSMAKLVVDHGADAEGFSARQLTPAVVREADLVLALTSEHRSAVVSYQPGAVQRTFVLGEFSHMVRNVEPGELDAATGADADEASRLRGLVTLAKTRRTPGIDPAEDVPDPYRGSTSEYARSFELIAEYLHPVVRLLTPTP